MNIQMKSSPYVDVVFWPKLSGPKIFLSYMQSNLSVEFSVTSSKFGSHGSNVNILKILYCTLCFVLNSMKL